MSDNPYDASHVNARQKFQEAERILEQNPVQSSAEWRQEWIQLQIDQLFPLRGSVDEMTAIIEKAQAIVEQYGTAEQRAYFLLATVARDVTRDCYVIAEGSIPALREALTTFEQTGNMGTIGFTRFSLGVHLLWSDDPDEAEEHLQAAIRIGEQIKNSALVTRAMTFLPFLFRRRGQVEQVRDILTRALGRSGGRKNSILTGHRAWVAWRDGNLAEAEMYGRDSLEEGPARQNVNVFRWVGVWPLIGVALVQERLADGLNYVRILLDPTQQPPPEKVRTLLETALQTWDAGQQERAAALLQEVVPHAKQMGYL